MPVNVAVYQCNRCHCVVSLYVRPSHPPEPSYTGTYEHRLRGNEGPCYGVLRLAPDGVQAAFLVGGHFAVKDMYPGHWYVSL